MEKLCESSTMSGHIFNDGGGEIGIFFTGHQEDGLNLFGDLSIHEGHLKLMFEV
jgi:hypothetical protein